MLCALAQRCAPRRLPCRAAGRVTLDNHTPGQRVLGRSAAAPANAASGCDPSSIGGRVGRPSSASNRSTRSCGRGVRAQQRGVGNATARHREASCPPRSGPDSARAFRRAEASAAGSPVRPAPSRSASYSRVRDRRELDQAADGRARGRAAAGRAAKISASPTRKAGRWKMARNSAT